MFDYYVHFNQDTGEIYSITNEPSDTDHEVTTVSYADVEKFLSGKENFVNYKVSLKDRVNYKLVKRAKLSSFQLENVYTMPAHFEENAELVVTKNTSTKTWSFVASEQKREELADLDVNFRLRFFVAKNTNFNFLIRELTVDTIDLAQAAGVSIPFVKDIESSDDTIIITSKFFETYTLEIE